MAPITPAELDVYLKFGGDSDGFARLASPAERALVDGAQWARIEQLRLELGLLVRGQLSDGAQRRLRESLPARAADESVVRRLAAAA